MKHNRKNTIFLFDVDGTLTPSRQSMPDNVRKMLIALRQKVSIAFVGGSDIEKQQEQMGKDCLTFFDYSFPENGLSFYEGETLVSQKNIIEELGDDLSLRFINYCLMYLSKIRIPLKRGNFIECRNSIINISPIGRTCSQEERMQFVEYDNIHKIRANMVEAMKEEFKGENLQFSIGGQISIDCFPVGWDKRYCISHIHGKGIETIYFFGDMTHLGGNDYEIFNDKNVIGISVKNPDDTIKKVNELLENMEIE